MLSRGAGPAGEYSAEKLRELKSNTRSLPAAKAVPRKPAVQPEFKLSGSFKRTDAPQDDRFDIRHPVVRLSASYAWVMFLQGRGWVSVFSPVAVPACVCLYAWEGFYACAQFGLTLTSTCLGLGPHLSSYHQVVPRHI
jgi:hypothetical protein